MIRSWVPTCGRSMDQLLSKLARKQLKLLHKPRTGYAVLLWKTKRTFYQKNRNTSSGWSYFQSIALLKINVLKHNTKNIPSPSSSAKDETECKKKDKRKSKHSDCICQKSFIYLFPQISHTIILALNSFSSNSCHIPTISLSIIY